MSDAQFYAIVAVAAILVIAMVACVVVLGIRVYRTAKSLPTLTPGGKFAFYGALIYSIFPIDVLPDPIYLDDIGVLAGALVYLTRLANKSNATRPAARQDPSHPSALPRR